MLKTNKTNQKNKDKTLTNSAFQPSSWNLRIFTSTWLWGLVGIGIWKWEFICVYRREGNDVLGPSNELNVFNFLRPGILLSLASFFPSILNAKLGGYQNHVLSLWNPRFSSFCFTIYGVWCSPGLDPCLCLFWIFFLFVSVWIYEGKHTLEQEMEVYISLRSPRVN